MRMAPEYRTFDGKRYRLDSCPRSKPRSKREAQAAAKSTRSYHGELARVVRLPSGQYVVYARKSR